ncbi:MAG TPA: glycosyltransferase family 4 protein [Chthoniobacteraceae bacterium]|jgi:glycosyltransferase involved in cell wall biosynthesis
MLAPISWRVPPRHYGPWEQIVSTITEGLVARGVEVTLFATADSLTAASLESVCPMGYSEDPSLDAKVWEGMHIAHCFERAGDFDLIHNHFDFLPLTYSGLVSTPVLTTIHGFSSSRILPAYRRYDQRTHYVSISNADRSPDLSYAATIHHGIEIEQFPLSETDSGYLLFFGRIHPDKGCAEAVALAQRLGRPLQIAGIIQDEGYFHREVEPHLGDEITYIGPVGPERRAQLLGGAAVLLHLINFDEPFGLSVVEAMACGTPVIATARGSMPELIEPGINGFLINAPSEADGAVAACAELDRKAVRASVSERFSAERMVDDYIRVYLEITGSRTSGRK